MAVIVEQLLAAELLRIINTEKLNHALKPKYRQSARFKMLFSLYNDLNELRQIEGFNFDKYIK